MKEQEPIKEKLPICGGCEQIINTNNPEIVYLRFKGKAYHEDCLKVELAKENDKGISELPFMKAMKENKERFK